jgi:hypothetical protein
MLTLTDHQLRQVQTAAAMLPVNARDSFLRSVANRLATIHQPNDHQVNSAISFVLGLRGIAVGQSRHKEQHHARRELRSHHRRSRSSSQSFA